MTSLIHLLHVIPFDRQLIYFPECVPKGSMEVARCLVFIHTQMQTGAWESMGPLMKTLFTLIKRSLWTAMSLNTQTHTAVQTLFGEYT